MVGKQAAAAVGQCELMYSYDKQFSTYGHVTAQVLLTLDVVEDEQRKRNVVNTINRLLEYGAVPIVNENDTVSYEEIESAESRTFGDNDTPVGHRRRADRSRRAGDASPTSTGCIPPIPLPCRREAHPGGGENRRHSARRGQRTGSARGTGGMITKLNAAEIAQTPAFPPLS